VQGRRIHRGVPKSTKQEAGQALLDGNTDSSGTFARNCVSMPTLVSHERPRLDLPSQIHTFGGEDVLSDPCHSPQGPK
jgi:hypothetical protein